MTECIASPKITFLDLYPTPEDRQQIFAEMVGLGFFNPSLPSAALCIHEYPKVWLYQWQEDGSWSEEPRTVYDDTWHAHCIYVTAELLHRRFDSRLVMAMAAAHQLSALNARHGGD